MMRLMQLIWSALLFLVPACGSDIGVVTTKKVVGEMGYDHYVTVDQAVDIVFLMDKSGSMYDDVDRVNDTLFAIYMVLIGDEFTDLQWRVGAKSMSPSEDLTLFVDWDDPDADLKLASLASAISSYGDETGLDAAISSVAWDDLFYRDNADLLFVFISDELDQSSVTPDYYMQVMGQVKSPPFMVTESAIVVTEGSACLNSGASIGTGYTDVSEIVIDMCDTENWIDVLDDVRDHLPQLNTVFALSEVPVEPATDNIEVRVNSEVSYDWTYDEKKNQITLGYVPPAASDIDILYLVPPTEE